MTPFLQFRVWLRRGPSGEHVLAAIAAVLALALGAWTLVPADEDDGSTNVAADSGISSTVASESSGGAGTAEGPQPGTADSGTPAGAAGTSAGGEAGEPVLAEAATGTATTPSPDGCAGLRSNDQGISPSEIFVAVPLLNLGGDVGNETFGIRADLEAVANATAAGVNSEGGVACRKLRIKTYRVNPLDQNEQRSKCLQIAGDKPFAVIDFASYLDPVDRACFIENKLPYEGATSITEEEASGGAPYMYSVLSSTDRQLRNWVFETAARGGFDRTKGFRKLGVIQNSCAPKVNDELERNLGKVGVSEDALSTFTISCSSVAPPNEISSAVLQHRRDNASHVLLAVAVANSQSYVRNADGLGWKPVYMASDYGSVTNSSPAKDWQAGFDGTIGITSQRGGELNAGIVAPQVARCQEWMKKANVRPPTAEGDAALAMCDMFRLFVAAANGAGPGLVRTSLLDGLSKVGRFESAGFGDGLYDRRGKVTGGDFIRSIQWRVDCKCWKLVDRDTKPGH